jgi:23S rRNA pseudouridine1911/1915/1917 synthase
LSSPPSRLDKALSRDAPAQAGLSRTRLTRLITEGYVEIDGNIVKNPTANVSEGQAVKVLLPELEFVETLPQKIKLDIIYEDADLLVVNKVAGMVVHPAPGSPKDTLVNALLYHCLSSLSGIGGEKRPGIVHRIDKDTSGLLVVAKNDKSHHGLAEQFERHSVERVYHAFCHGTPDVGSPRLKGVKGVSFEVGNVVKISTHLARHKHDRQRQTVLFEGGRHAVTRFKVLEKFGNPQVVSLIECWLETGRTHQIRVHMAHLGHSLIGDTTYGRRKKISNKALNEESFNSVNKFHRQALHASFLGFIHPLTSEYMKFSVDMPSDMQNLASGLKR